MEPGVERDRGVDTKDIVLFMGEADDEKVANVIEATNMALPKARIKYAEKMTGGGRVAVGARIMDYGGLLEDEVMSRLRYTFASYEFIEF